MVYTISSIMYYFHTTDHFQFMILVKFISRKTPIISNHLLELLSSFIHTLHFSAVPLKEECTHVVSIKGTTYMYIKLYIYIYIYTGCFLTGPPLKVPAGKFLTKFQNFDKIQKFNQISEL